MEPFKTQAATQEDLITKVASDIYSTENFMLDLLDRGQLVCIGDTMFTRGFYFGHRVSLEEALFNQCLAVTVCYLRIG